MPAGRAEEEEVEVGAASAPPPTLLGSATAFRLASAPLGLGSSRTAEVGSTRPISPPARRRSLAEKRALPEAAAGPKTPRGGGAE